MKIHSVEILGLDNALYAMRMPHLSQSKKTNDNDDIQLAKKLITLGTEHRKFMRQFNVHIHMEASMTFWFEFDTYKVGVTSNSESFWFSIGKQDKLSMNQFVEPSIPNTEHHIALEKILKIINEYKEKENPSNTTLRYLVPQGVKYQRVVSLTGEALFNIFKQRQNHRLSEWREFTLECFKWFTPSEKELFSLALKKKEQNETHNI